MDFERTVRERPNQVTIQSWNRYPSHVLPETDPTALTSLVEWYCDHTTVDTSCR